MSTTALKDLITLLMNFAISAGLTYLTLYLLGSTILRGGAGLIIGFFLIYLIPLIWVIFVFIVWEIWHRLNEAFHIV